MTELSVAVAGLGRAGTAVLRECIAAPGVRVLGAWNRTERDIPGLATRLGDRLSFGGVAPPAALQGADLLLLAVSDRAVPELAAALRPPEQTAVVHLSGAADVSLLSELPSGAAGCWHPLQAFTGAGDAQGPPYAVALQGSAAAVQRGRELAERLGHPAVELAADGRAAYHAAAVLASNCLVALQATAVRVMGSAGVSDEEAWQLLWPLVHGTLQNLRGGPVVQSLTGPIARGDVGTVARNLDALRDDPAARAVYEALGIEALTLMDGGSASGEVERNLEAIRQLLTCVPAQT